MRPILEVSGLSKSYRLMQFRRTENNLRDVIAETFRLGRGRAQKAEAHKVIWALRDVSFEAKPGERIGIIGRNGAGKSTLLKILSRTVKPTSGGADIYGRVGSLLEIGTGFHPDLTGRENVYLNGGIIGMRREEIRRKFDEIVAFAEVEEFLDTPLKYYSSGMSVRLAFAVAAHLEPELLILDEVLAVGDIAFQQKCLRKMREISGDGRTVLYVSHDLSSVRELCEHTLLIEKGRLHDSGPTEAVIENYLARLSHPQDDH